MSRIGSSKGTGLFSPSLNRQLKVNGSHSVESKQPNSDADYKGPERRSGKDRRRENQRKTGVYDSRSGQGRRKGDIGQPHIDIDA